MLCAVIEVVCALVCVAACAQVVNASKNNDAFVRCVLGFMMFSRFVILIVL